MNSELNINNDNIASIDNNFALKTSLDIRDIRYYDIRKSPFAIYGLCEPSCPPFKRMPLSVASSVSNGVKNLNLNTAGGRVRFKTDSRYVAIKCCMPALRKMPHMPLSGSSGFDMYSVHGGHHRYEGSFIPSFECETEYESVIYLPDSRERDIIINFPTYGRVDSLYIGVQEASFVAEGGKYKYDKPVLYYGSSVTQGGCSSRSGTNYQSVISQRLDCDYINLGFSGNAKGEEQMADYLAKIDASVFVCDYDYNTPSVGHLEKTHMPIYLKYRAAHPNTPIIFVSAPATKLERYDLIKRREVVFKTYMYAVDHGDRNVSYIDGYAMFAGFDRDGYTVDGTHPNDAGFLRMADVIGGEIRYMLLNR